MNTYSVVASDGNLYGPADENALATWAREGRINAQTQLQCHETGQRVMANTVPALQQVLGLTPQMRNDLIQRQIPQQQAYAQPPQQAYPQQQQPGYVQPQQGYATQPVGYAQPTGYAYGSNAHTLTSFSTGLSVLLFFVTNGLFQTIHFGLMHGKLPKNRPDDPSAGKAIGFMFIPIFNLYWAFFVNLRFVDRINEQRVLAGMPPGNQKSLFTWSLILLLVSIPLIFIFIGIFTFLAGFVMMVIYYASVQTSVNELVLRTRGPGV